MRGPFRDAARGLHQDPRTVQTADGQRLALIELTDPKTPAEKAAEGPVFLLVHGFGQNRLGFTLGGLPRELLARGARVFLAELRGHGASRSRSQAPWSLAQLLDDDCPALLEGVADWSGSRRVHWIGHSLGGLLGIALLGRGAALASLTTLASPVQIGACSPLVRLASVFAGPLASVAPRGRWVPMNHLLGLLSGPLSREATWGGHRLLQRAAGLANPAQAEPPALARILASAEPESPRVFLELARNAVLARSRLADVDLVQALRGSDVPAAAVVGTADSLAPPQAVAPFRGSEHRGPRLVIEIEGGTHLDAAMGYHVPETLHRVWRFLEASGAL